MLYKNLIYIHIPKTGGNSVQKILSLNGKYEGIFKTDKKRDGIDRFEIEDNLTDYKHQKLSVYNKKCSLSEYKIFTLVRNPTDRLISYYFSPSHHIKNDNIFTNLFGKFSFKTQEKTKFKPIKFEYKKFLKFIDSVDTQSSFISIDNKIYNDLKIIKFENWSEELKSFLYDCNLHFQNIHINKKIDYSDRQKLIKDYSLEEIIRSTKHKIDYDNFYL